MPFYVWPRIEALKRYSSGWAMAEAPDVDAARVKVRAAFKAWMEEHRYYNKDEPDFWNPPFEQFEKDIAGVPEKHDTYLVQGSD
jgi:hypothetical protein